ncbi:MAG TPA: site-2 protease family protein [Dehalococcoidia bacterium]|nr:site-2 protease family protein [Dehalococcoidia bacterium]HIK89274.1 site-2 protease family protein [Dehalococcoidia bacterium]
MNGSIKLVSVLGIPVEINATWLIAFVGISFYLSVVIFPDFISTWSIFQYWLAGTITTLLLFISVLAHELGHSIVALGQGLRVQGIVLLIFGGVSKIQGEASRPRNEFFIAFSGPAISFAIGIVFTIWWFSFLPISEDQVTPLHGVILYTGRMNLIVAVFNLIPAFPMDGGRVLRSIVWGVTGDPNRATNFAYAVGRYVFYVFIGYGAWQIINGDFGGGIWIIAIASFLMSSGKNEVRGRRAAQAMGSSPPDSSSSDSMDQLSFDVGRATRPMPPMFEAGWSVEQVTYQGLPANPLTSIPVGRQGELIGFILKQDLDNIPIHKRVSVTVGELMDSGSLRVISTHEPARSALQQMDGQRVNQLVVMEEDFVVGMVTRQDIVETLIEFRSANESAGSSDCGTPV